VSSYTLVMQRYWFLEFDTISIRYRYFISKQKSYVAYAIPGEGSGEGVGCHVASTPQLILSAGVKLLVWAT